MIIEKMIELLRYEVMQQEFDSSDFADLSAEDWGNIYRLSKHQDIAHLVGDAALKKELLPEGELKNKFLKQSMLAVQRLAKLEYDTEEIKRVLSERKIPFLPLKGSVLRYYYPEPWMRTSCDVDILLHEEDLESAKTALEKELGYTFGQKGSHDIGGISPYGISVELHYTLLESSLVSTAEKPLLAVWQYAKEGSTPFCYEMSDAMFYYYHIAHMAKHFENGGCGVRPFIDLFILAQSGHCGALSEREALLQEGALTAFASAAEELTGVWFQSKPHSELTRQMENYLLSGGIYGNLENRISVQQASTGSKGRYLLSRIWLPYEKMRFYYPSAEKHRLLLPFYELRRWFRLLFCGGFKRSANELAVQSSTTQSQIAEAKEMLRQLGLL